jgi:hypothetical protein
VPSLPRQPSPQVRSQAPHTADPASPALASSGRPAGVHGDAESGRVGGEAVDIAHHLRLVDDEAGPSRQTTVSLTRPRSAGACSAGPPPRRAIALSRSGRGDNEIGPSVAVEVDRAVNASGLVGIAGRVRQRGARPGRSPDHPAAGRRPRARHRRRRPGPHLCPRRFRCSCATACTACASPARSGPSRPGPCASSGVSPAAVSPESPGSGCEMSTRVCRWA